MSGPDPSAVTNGSVPRRVCWPWALLAVALAWTVVERIPLVLNGASHLDSDLAVDGLALLDAVHGHWRWHFPGTPHIGSAPLVALAPLALVRGVTPTTLAIGGTVIAGSVVAATFFLAWRAFGPRVASWSLVPLTFASSGTLWLSGWITGGHLLAVVWHALAFAGLYSCLDRGGRLRAARLGLWCGLGLWNDSMFLVSLGGLVAAGIAAWMLAGRSRTGLLAGLIFAASFGVGIVPKFIGNHVDPHNSYPDTFKTIWTAEVLSGHAKILGSDCLPRLLVGHRLPGLEAEPGGITLAGRPRPATASTGIVAVLVVGLGLGLFVLAIVGLGWDRGLDQNRARWAVRWGLLLTMAAVLSGFLLNRNIYDSDNQRYLVLLLVPWAIGFGRLMDGFSRKGQGGAMAAGLVGLAFAVLFTLDSAAWYRQLGWIDEAGWPVSRPLDDPMLTWLDSHREVTHLYGDYWDVYRLSMLTGGRVRGIPSPQYPNRFPEWSIGLPAKGRIAVLARPTPIGAESRRQALREGGRTVYQAAGGVIVGWP